MSVSADLLLRYLLGKLWLVPPQYHKSPQIPPKPRLSHPGSSGLSCCRVTLGDKGSSSWQMVFQLACLPACQGPVSQSAPNKAATAAATVTCGGPSSAGRQPRGQQMSLLPAACGRQPPPLSLSAASRPGCLASLAGLAPPPASLCRHTA